ncbi:hypothetical protein [Streptomyces chattanoogensis]|uniref:hypothetical protein n=1 Tax=Streptomyces chattanoogensis TaxID=66876 RepID=UPI0036CF8768
MKRSDALQALDTALSLEGAPTAPLKELIWDTRCFRQWANTFATQTVDGIPLATRHRVAYQQVFDPRFKQVWWNYLTADRPCDLPRRLACAVIRPETDLTDQATVSRLLTHETSADRVALARYVALNDETSKHHRGFFPEAIKDSVARQLLETIWHVRPDAVEEEAWARGFQGAQEAIETVKLFVLGLLRDQEGGR